MIITAPENIGIKFYIWSPTPDEKSCGLKLCAGPLDMIPQHKNTVQPTTLRSAQVFFDVPRVLLQNIRDIQHHKD